MGSHKAWIGAAGAAALAAAFTGQADAAGYPYYGPSYGGLYIGASVGEAFYNEDGIPQLTPTIAMFRIGEQFNPYLALEARLGTGISGDTSYGYHANFDAIYGGYLKGMLPVTPWLSPYAIAGVGGQSISRNYPDFHSNDAGLSFGGGLEFNLGGAASANLEWVRLVNNGNNFGYNFNTDLVTIGINWHPYLY